MFSVESKIQTCIIENCNKILSSNFVHNLRRHKISCLNEYAVNLAIIKNDENEPKKQKKKISINIDENTFLKACVT